MLSTGEHVVREVMAPWTLAALTVILGSCSASPGSPAGPTSVPLPQVTPSNQSLTGIVYQSTQEGRRTVANARVFVVDLIDGPYGSVPWYQVTTNDQGRFNLPLPLSREVKITAYAGEGFGLWNQSGLSQVAAVHPMVTGSTSVEIELVRDGVLPRILDAPVLSGVIFETTVDGRRPAADMAVIYSSHRHDGADVYTRTDSDGRYRFFGVPPGDGYLLPACTRATTLPPNYRPRTFPIEVQGDTVLNAICL